MGQYYTHKNKNPHLENIGIMNQDSCDAVDNVKEKHNPTEK